jgi:hypothetical protein
MITKFKLFEINNNDIQDSIEYKNRIDELFDEFRNEEIEIKYYDDLRTTQLDIKTVFNKGEFSVYITNDDDSITLHGYKEGTGQGLIIRNNTTINEKHYSFFLKLIKTVARYTKWDDKYTSASIKELQNHIY